MLIKFKLIHSLNVFCPIWYHLCIRLDQFYGILSNFSQVYVIVKENWIISNLMYFMQASTLWNECNYNFINSLLMWRIETDYIFFLIFKHFIKLQSNSHMSLSLFGIRTELNHIQNHYQYTSLLDKPCSIKGRKQQLHLLRA